MPCRMPILNFLSMSKVLIVQRRMTHYRISFFETLRSVLAQRGVELLVASGSGSAAEMNKKDGGELPWAIKLPTRYFLGGKLCWQPFQMALAGVDLLVVTPENKMIYNLVAQYLHRSYRLALWGHGANLQGNPASFRERFKRQVAKRADWWFAYTDLSVPLIRASGFPAERITVLDNAIDTGELRDQFLAVDRENLEKLKSEIGLQGGKVGLYLGSLYAEKRIPFLLQAATAIRAKVPGFEFLIVGSGTDQGVVQGFCRQHPWAHFLGVRKGQAKADVLALADVMLNPGLVGLGVLDSFVCGVPLVTTDCGLHSPEIAYLKNGINGLVTPDTQEDYVAAVVALFSDESTLSRLKAGCESSAGKYTLDNMARNFADGVTQCLAAPLYRGRGGL